MQYCIIETEDGWAITEVPENLTAAEVAAESGAEIIDPGPYDSYEEASDALMSLQAELSADDTSDLPGTRAIESREEES
jgi:hypothetical protein